MTMYDDPNREAVGLEPIWTGADLAPEPIDEPEPEPEPPADEPEPDDGSGQLPGDVAGFTADHVKAWVERHPGDAATVLANEKARGTARRRTLMDWLQGYVDERPS